MKRIAALVSVALLVACATQAKFAAKMNGFVGQPELVVVSTYGPPQSSYTLGDGSKVISYTRGGTVMLPGYSYNQPVTTNTTGHMTLNNGLGTWPTTGNYTSTSTTYVPQQTAATPLQVSCTVNFTVDRDGVIRQWTASGNNCVAQ